MSQSSFASHRTAAGTARRKPRLLRVLHPNVAVFVICMIVLLSNIRSLHNVGSIFRTADAFGISKLYLCGITPTPIDDFGGVRSQLAKVSLGAEKTIPWEHFPRIGKAIATLRREGYTIVALEQTQGALPYYDFKPTSFDRIAIIVGHEVQGIALSVLKRVDTTIEIPMYGKKESLNVSVAFGVVAGHYRAQIANNKT